MGSMRQKVVSVPPGGAWVQGLEGHADCQGWRTVQIVSPAPVDCELSWTNALGATAPLRFSVARVAQVCVVGSRWSVRVQNPASAGQPVRVSTSILHEKTDTAPVLEEHAPAAPSPTPATHAPPAWSTALRVDTSAQALAGTLVELLDAEGVVRASVTQVGQPLWIPLGLAASVRVTCEAPHRLVWRMAPL